MATTREVDGAPVLSSHEGVERLRVLRGMARTDALSSFEGALDVLRGLVRSAAREALDPVGTGESCARPARDALKLIGRLLKQDSRRREHEIDRESGWFLLFEIWIQDDAGLLDDFEGFLSEAALLGSDRRQLVKLAMDELGDLPLVFPLGSDGDVRRVVLKATRIRLESVIASLLSKDGRHAYAVAIRKEQPAEAHDSLDTTSAPIPSEERTGGGRGAGRALRLHLETAFLRNPSEESFHAIKTVVPETQWPDVRSRLLGHLQKHQREPSLVFKLYWDEGLFLDADGLVVTQPVDPDVLARAAMKLREHDPIVSAGWLLIAACRLADSFPKSRWPDVVGHLVVVRDLTASSDREGEFQRVLRTFRFRHAQSPDLLSRLSEVGL
jgi:hypothetical protein